MNAFRLFRISKTCSLEAIFVGVAIVLTGSFPTASAVTVTANADVSAGAQASLQFHSPGTGEILKMVDAKVDVAVIKAYIKNSPVAYNPTAAEIVAMKEHGISSDIIVAMLQRGGEIRTQAIQAAPAQPPMGTPPYRTDQYVEPGYNYPGGYSDAYSYPYSYSDYYPSYYPYYSYPYYAGYYGYGWPYYYSSYWPSLYFGFRPFGFGHPFFHRSFPFRGHSFAFRGGSSFAFRGGVHVNSFGHVGSFTSRGGFVGGGHSFASHGGSFAFHGGGGGFRGGGGGFHGGGGGFHGGGGGHSFGGHGR